MCGKDLRRSPHKRGRLRGDLWERGEAGGGDGAALGEGRAGGLSSCGTILSSMVFGSDRFSSIDSLCNKTDI